MLENYWNETDGDKGTAMQGDTKFIRTMQLSNLLSFGPDTPPIEFESLNVLIGPNGSGKSNAIEAIDLLRAAATDLVAPVRAGGGTQEWLWKGVEKPPNAEINATLTYPGGRMPLRHRISFTAVGQRFELIDEAIEEESIRSSRKGTRAHARRDIYFFYRYEEGQPKLLVRPARGSGEAGIHSGRYRHIRSEDLTPNQSVLSQRRDPDQYPEITYLGNGYHQFRLYREWNVGPNTAPRLPQPADLPNDFLAENANNLALVLNDLSQRREAKNAIFGRLAQFYDQFEELLTYLKGGTVQVYFQEKGLLQPVSSSRMSDGTLRFLCLASILCHPSPPLLVCIEEPEIGLHPDILPVVAEMLIEASQKTQIIVTTHSDILVDALSQVPEVVQVCEKVSNSTSVRRLDQERLRLWLKEYTLGDLWRSGELGGNRW